MASNIKPVIINKPVVDTTYYGINGGYFLSDDYSEAPTGGVGIHWNKGESGNHEYNGTSSSDAISRGTFFTFNDGGTIKAGIWRAKSVTDLKNQLGTSVDFLCMIGGGDLALSFFYKSANRAKIETRNRFKPSFHTLEKM